MILSSLKLQNYKKYQEFTIDFNEGLIGIIGKNGAGKSTIFDAIIFALYGNIRGERLTIKNTTANNKEPVVVELIFEIENRSYRVKRELRGKSLVIKAAIYNEKSELLSEGAKEVNRYIIKLIGMSEDAFRHTVFASQKELTALSSLKNEDRKKIIRKLLGLEKIDKIELEIRDRLRVLKSEINAISTILLSEDEVKIINHELKEFKSSLKVLENSLKQLNITLSKKSLELENLQKELKSWQDLKDNFLQIESSLSVAKSNLKNFKDNLTQKSLSIKELEEKALIYSDKSYLIDEFKEIENSLKIYQKQKEQFLQKDGLEKEQNVLRSQYKSAKAEIDSLKKELELEPNLNSNRLQKYTFIKSCKEEIERIEDKERSLRAEASKYKTLIDNNNKQLEKIKKLGKDSNCPTCTRPLLDEYDLVTNTLNENINYFKEQLFKIQNKLNSILKLKNSQRDSLTKLEQELNKIDSNLMLLASKRDTLNKKVLEFSGIEKRGKANNKMLEKLANVIYSQDKHNTVLNKKVKIEPEYKKLRALEPLIAQIPKEKDELSSINSKIEKVAKEIKELELKVSNHKYSKEQHIISENRYKQALKEKDEITKELNIVSLEHSKIEGQIETLNSKLLRDAQQKEQLQLKIDDRVDYEKLKAFMGDFKNRINSQISPRISQFASKMYSTITRGKYQHIEVTNEFDFYIYDNGIKYPIERFSGGEIDLANLVLRIAISKTLSELNGSSGIGFLAFDEVFGSQDQERRFEIMEAFHSIKEQYRQIFLISHESEIKEMFERVLELN